MTPVRPSNPSPALFVIVATILACVLGGCHSGRPQQASGEMVIRLPQPEGVTTWDPATVEDGPTIEVLMHVAEGLVQWTPDNRLVPCLAEMPAVSNGGRRYTFKIKEGVKFHNGRPLKAEDFVYSINRALNPATRSQVAGTYLNDIVGARDVLEGRAASASGVTAPDDGTLVIDIDKPKAYFLAKLTYPTAYAIAKEGVEAGGGSITEPAHLIGTGPFTVSEYARDHHITMGANRAYHEGPPKLSRMERRIITSAETRRQMFDNGELDIVDVTMADYQRDQNDPEVNKLVHIQQRAALYYFAFNQQFEPFKDRRVRQAFTMAIDRDRIVKDILLGVPPRSQGILPIAVPGYDPAFRGLPFDPERARKLLAEAGYPGGQGFPPLTLSFREGYPDIRRVCEVAEQDLTSHLGIKVKLQQMSYAELLKQRNDAKLPFYFLRWSADYLDPQNFLSVMLRSGVPENRISYSNAEFDSLCDAADTEQDRERRLEMYRKAERIAVDDAAWAPVYLQTDIELWSPRVHGIPHGAMGRLPLKTTTVQ